MSLKSHFVTIAKYNAWANARLYKMARELPDEDYRKNVGAYFGSLQGTLNHILNADRIWMRRLTGTGEHPDKLNAIALMTYLPSKLPERPKMMPLTFIFRAARGA